MNTSNRLFGGQLLSWIDEEAAIYASCQMKHDRVVTKFMSEIDFKISAKLGDILEIGLEVVDVGRTSLSMRCEVRQKKTREAVIFVERIVFVSIDTEGIPVQHGHVETQNRVA